MNDSQFIQLQADIGCTNLKLAEWLDVKPETISRWRNGSRKVSGPVVLAMRALASGWRP